MTKIKEFSQQKPVLFSLVVCCITYMCMRGSSLLLSFLPDNTAFDFLEELFCILWPIVLTILLGFGFIYNKKGFGTTLKAGMAIFVFSIFSIVVKYLDCILLKEPHWASPSVIILGILTVIGIGIREEAIFRGVIANSLAFKYATDKKGLWLAVIVSALLFGGVHITNLFHGVEPVGLIAQMFGAFTAGILYAAIYFRGGNIWLLMLLHALEDSVGLFESTFTVTTLTEVDQVSNLNLTGALIMGCIHICLAIFLLRKSKQPAVFARLEQLRNQ